MKVSPATIAAALAALLAGMLSLPLVAAGMLAGPVSATAAGIPPRVLAAYQAVDGACPGLRWELVAGIGWLETRHGTSHGAQSDEDSGEVTPWIFGPPLDGRGGVEAHPLGPWTGQYGLSGRWERAVGPMQFRPATFAHWATDADHDGRLDPHDVDDAVATAAAYLCGPPGRVDDERQALARYNRSATYAVAVLDYAARLDVAGGAGLCPVAGPTSFTDTWGAPRSGGRRHRGVDMFAAEGTPTVAPVPGTVEHYTDRLGGLSFRLWGDDGNYYFGTHLRAFGPSDGHVDAGALVGYVGHTGNAAGTPPHLHFEIHPGRRRGDPPAPVDPTPAVAVACRSGR